MESKIVQPDIEESWMKILSSEFYAPYMTTLKTFLLEEKKQHIVYPPGNEIFSAFNYTPFHQVKVVILGQDPYHGTGQAHGLCFSVKKGIKPPPSLVNIFKELQQDVGITPPPHGELTSWAKQGVLLLNATLTVRAGNAGSHQGKGWETFTDAAIRAISENHTGIVFLLWGKYAQAKESLINTSTHIILKAPHPSPFSAHTGFLGCRHFSKTNEELEKQGKEKINWQID